MAVVARPQLYSFGGGIAMRYAPGFPSLPERVGDDVLPLGVVATSLARDALLLLRCICSAIGAVLSLAWGFA